MDFLTKILAAKKREVADLPLETVGQVAARRSFGEYLAVHANQVQVIAEVKRASPSKGDINPTVDIIQQAREYAAAGAAAISVLTDPTFFKGSIADLRQIAEAVPDIPLLCKDFIISEKQLIRAKNNGASIVLLIVAALTTEQLRVLYQKAVELELEVLVEVHDEPELLTALTLPTAIIGVNNRDLKTFEVRIAVSEALAGKGHRLFVSESGFKTAADVQRIAAGYQAVLVGETLMRTAAPAVKIRELQVAR